MSTMREHEGGRNNLKKHSSDFAESDVRIAPQSLVEQPTCPRCGGTGSDVSRYPIAGCGCTQVREGKE